ncbi:YqhR family membrane protein [Fictibacillus sp. Mic-4]|uniref:YqhR family membrane protein n=1 Tax=Fictibacillus sp. Mic-4 TaxID=3132826 RepID=UPI003CFA82D9
MEDKKSQQMETDGSFMSRVISVGFFGGLIWSLLAFLAYYLNFTKVGPALILAPWALGKWKNEWLGHLIGVVILALLSILVAIGYRFLLSKVKSMWAGILYGTVLWFIVFYVLHPIFPGLEPMNKIGKNTVVTTLCLFILYGLFIGMTISFEYSERYGTNNQKSS